MTHFRVEVDLEHFDQSPKSSDSAPVLFNSYKSWATMIGFDTAIQQKQGHGSFNATF